MPILFIRGPGASGGPASETTLLQILAVVQDILTDTNILVTDPATGTKQDAQTVLLSAIEQHTDDALPLLTSIEADTTTIATQTTALNNKTTLGQQTMAASIAVVLPSNQSTLPVNQQTDGGTVSTDTKTIGNVTPVRLTVSGSAPAANRIAMVFTPDPTSVAIFYIGDSGVTAADGLPITAGEKFIANDDGADYYVLASIASQSGTVLERYP